MTETNHDMKQSFIGSKPMLALSDYNASVFSARAGQYGNFIYTLGNYLRPAPPGITDAEVLLEYMSAAMRHLSKTALSIKRFMGGGKGAAATLQEACYAKDTDSRLGVPPSNLPHLCGALKSVEIAIQKAVDAGLLPEDPGVTWDTSVKKEEKSDPYTFSNGGVAALKGLPQEKATKLQDFAKAIKKEELAEIDRLYSDIPEAPGITWLKLIKVNAEDFKNSNVAVTIKPDGGTCSSTTVKTVKETDIEKLDRIYPDITDKLPF